MLGVRCTIDVPYCTVLAALAERGKGPGLLRGHSVLLVYNSVLVELCVVHIRGRASPASVAVLYTMLMAGQPEPVP